MHLIAAIDGSEPSERALAHARSLVEATDGRLTVIHVVDPHVYEQRIGEPILEREAAEQQLVIEAIEHAEIRGQELLAETVDGLDPDGIEVGDELLYGDPVEAIAEYAEHHDEVDGIVVGHRDLSDQYQRVLGSVAKGLVERAPVPVTVVR